MVQIISERRVFRRRVARLLGHRTGVSWMPLRLGSLLFLVAFWFHSNRPTINRSLRMQYTSSRNNSKSDTCRFYLAESAIPHSGWGLFTAVDLKQGDLGQPFADICIYVPDTPLGNHFLTHSWGNDVWFGAFEGRNPRAACEGFATLFNTVPPGIQTSKLHMMGPHHNAGLRRDRDPGAGAVSQYAGIASVTTRPVEAGSELTIDYGDWTYQPDDYKQEPPKRTVENLQQVGLCIDNIFIDQATDRSMGRGAFASRQLKVGTIVSPAPVQVFHTSQFADTLFLNYGLQVQGLDLLLYPYGPGVNLINHSRQPNVGWRWSTHSLHKRHYLTSYSLDEYLERKDYPGALVLEIVAIRNIQKGEELFLDYGREWEEAWKEHVEQWSPDTRPYTYPQDMDRKEPFLTLQEQQKRPLTDNLQTVCWTDNWKRREHSPLPWRRPTAFDWPEGSVQCDILDRVRTLDSYNYTVALHYGHDPYNRTDTRFIDTMVPHEAIYYVDKPGSSDLHFGFRHPMKLPNHLVPSSWRR